MVLTADAPSTCFGCGPAHPSGLRLKFELSGHGAMVAEWVPSLEWQGYRGVIHGGIVSTVLDEAMAKSAAVFSSRGVTAELKVRFRRPVEPGQRLAIRAWAVEVSKRRILTEAVIIGADGPEYAHAWGTFLAPRAE